MSNLQSRFITIIAFHFASARGSLPRIKHAFVSSATHDPGGTCPALAALPLIFCVCQQPLSRQRRVCTKHASCITSMPAKAKYMVEDAHLTSIFSFNAFTETVPV